MISGQVPRVHTYSGSPYRTLEEFFLKHRPAEQIFKLNAARCTTIVGQKGTRLTFPANALSTTTGQLIEGNVQVRLTEVTNPLEGLLAARPTSSEDRVVDAVRQIQLTIFKDGSPLQLRAPVSVEIPMREDIRHPINVQLFTRSIPTVRAVRSNVFFDWRELKKAHVKVRKVGEKRYCEFEIKRCSWYQCGHLYARRSSKVMVTAKIIASTKAFESSEAFLWLDGSHVLTKLYSNLRQFSGLNIPAAASGHIIAFGMSEGQLHFGTARLKKAADKLLHIYMEPMPEAKIIEAIAHL